MAILTRAARIAFAEQIKAQPVFLAWGQGEASWDNQLPPASSESTALTNVLGYRKAKRFAYCVQDSDGEIQVPAGNYTMVNYPTPHLYCQFEYDITDGLSQTIRELGLMVGTEVKDLIPSSKTYFLADEIKHPGMLLLLEHRPAIYRDQGVKESFEFVISF
ncbi:hypothetical protein ACSLBF_04955 [Pseudoalteromonas sp. T1lg65]|uniref:hypothetical protein n=1 Tax=Pseudoalteromonas sp. T1lg65 TaxID=2077101 RepID=UPI003F7A2964